MFRGSDGAKDNEIKQGNRTTAFKVGFIPASYALVGLLAGCLIGRQALAQKPGEMEIRQGAIDQITEVDLQSNHHRGVGAIVGGLGGLGIGSLIGAGADNEKP